MEGSNLCSHTQYTQAICRISGKPRNENGLLERLRWILGIAWNSVLPEIEWISLI